MSTLRRNVFCEDLEARLLYRAAGVDVASFQGTPTWSSVYAAGKRFVYAKATEGTSYTNPDFSQQIGATGSSLVAGAYHFSDYGNAVSEADHFFSVAGSYMTDGYLRPTLDIEGTPPSGWTKTTVSNWVNNFANEIQTKTGGVDSVIYTSRSYASTWFNSTVTQWNDWIADYNGQDSQTGGPNGTTPWSTWNFWQYSSSLSVSGISGSVDGDVANGDMTTYVLPNLVIQTGSKFTNGQRVTVTATSGLKAWDTYTSNGTYTTEPDGEGGTIESTRPVYIQGYRRWEVLYDDRTANRWSAQDWLT